MLKNVLEFLRLLLSGIKILTKGPPNLGYLPTKTKNLKLAV